MKLHDLKPASGARTEKTRVGRGISAGKGKTAGRGTKGQKARAGASIPAWFEGGQTPIHMRVPKLRGFKNRFKIEYQVVNVGRISDYALEGRFAEAEEALVLAGAARPAGTSGDAPLTVNAETLRAVGLISSVRQPVKVLGQGEVGRKLFVLADAFTKGAREKIEAAGGIAQVLATAPTQLDAIGVDTDGRGDGGDAAPAEVAEPSAPSSREERTLAATGPGSTAVTGAAAEAANVDAADAAHSPVDPGTPGPGTQRRGRKTRDDRGDHG